ncbi:hypothetical protein BR93DRAFT_954615 [Coniochaeta sp. PMI_546]|nr:hypothetical protein BR93DRAFT_954615 [Coniochaeta sp. PMI_546]
MINGPPALVEMLTRNKKHGEAYKAPPHLMDIAPMIRDSGNGVVILTCSDPRVNPYAIFGLDSNLPAAIIRNTGGRAADALRTIANLQHVALPAAVVVMHHTDCGGSHVDPIDLKKALIELSPRDKEVIENAQWGKKITSSVAF